MNWGTHDTPPPPIPEEVQDGNDKTAEGNQGTIVVDSSSTAANANESSSVAQQSSPQPGSSHHLSASENSPPIASRSQSHTLWNQPRLGVQKDMSISSITFDPRNVKPDSQVLNSKPPVANKRRCPSFHQSVSDLALSSLQENIIPLVGSLAALANTTTAISSSSTGECTLWTPTMTSPFQSQGSAPQADMPSVSCDSEIGSIKRARVDLHQQQSLFGNRRGFGFAPSLPLLHAGADNDDGPHYFWCSCKTMQTQPPAGIINRTIKATGSYRIDGLKVEDSRFGSIQFVGITDLEPLGQQIDISDIVRFRSGGVEIKDEPSYTLTNLPIVIVFTGMKRQDFLQQVGSSSPTSANDGDLQQLINFCGEKIGAIYSDFSEISGKWTLLFPGIGRNDDGDE